MENLKKIFGVIVSTFFTTEGGVSLSEISRVQAENKQQNDAFWSKVAGAVDGMFRKEILFVGTGGGSPQQLNTPTITQEEIQEYVGVAARSSQTAHVMHGLKLWKRLQHELEQKDLRGFVVSSLPKPPERPVREELRSLPIGPECPAAAKLGTTCDTRVFMDMANIDEIIAVLVPEVLVQFNLAFWQRANDLNSRAAVLGKLLSEQGSFFRKLVEPRPKDDERVLQNGVVLTTWQPAYSNEQVQGFRELREQLQLEYNNLQRELNGLRKQIKDAVRAYNLAEERRYQEAYGLYQVEAEKHSLELERIRQEAETRFQSAVEAYRTAQAAYAVEMERIRSSAETLRQQAQAELAALRVRME